MNVSSIVAFTRDLPLVCFFIPTGFEHRFHILLLKYSYFITVSIAVQLFFYYNICFEESWIVLDDNYTFNFLQSFFFFLVKAKLTQNVPFDGYPKHFSTIPNQPFLSNMDFAFKNRKEVCKLQFV